MGTKRFALRHFDNNRLSAKDDVDNVGAGRAAKGANHFAPAVWVFARETSANESMAFLLTNLNTLQHFTLS